MADYNNIPASDQTANRNNWQIMKEQGGVRAIPMNQQMDMLKASGNMRQELQQKIHPGFAKGGPALNVNPKTFTSVVSGPTNGQSWSHEPKSQAWEKPPQFTKLEEAMHFLMDQLTDTEHLKPLLAIMEAGMPIEAIARTILFTGFSSGKWTPDLGMLMYKPLVLSLIAIAHRAGLKNTPITMKESMTDHLKNKTGTYAMFKKFKGEDIGTLNEPEKQLPSLRANNGFFTRQA